MAGSAHVKIDYSKAVSLKRETLMIEKNLLEIVKHTREYSSLKKREYLLKAKVKKNIIEIQELIEKIEPHLPKEELKNLKLLNRTQEIEHHQRTPKSIQPRKISSETSKRSSIEEEIQEIQAKLARLG